MRSAVKRSEKTGKWPLLELESRHLVDRQTGIRITGDSLGAPIHKKATEGVSCSTRKVPKEDVLAAKGGHRRLKLVDKEPIPTGKNVHPRTKDIYYHGRLQHRLGSTSREPSLLTAMDHRTTRLAYKSKRALCSLNGADQISRSNKGTGGNGSIRQQDCCGICEKSRWNEIIDTSGSDKGVTSAGTSSKGGPSPFLHPRSVQHHSGLSLSRQKSSRLASQQGYNDDNISKNGHAPNRSICDKSVQSSPPLCDFRCERSPSVICERVQQGVALPVGMDFPPSTSHPQGPAAPEQGFGIISRGCTTVGKRFLERRPQEEVSGSTVSNQEPGPAFDRPIDQSALFGNERSIFGGLEGTYGVEPINCRTPVGRCRTSSVRLAKLNVEDLQFVMETVDFVV